MADRHRSGVAWWELNAYCGRLADFIIDHIDKPYTAEECGHVLEVRQDRGMEELPPETVAAIRALIAEVDAGTAADITLDLIELLRPITGAPVVTTVEELNDAIARTVERVNRGDPPDRTAG